MLTKLKKQLLSEGFSTFLRFLSVFTAIFLLMTVLILQIMRIGIYSSVDDNINKAVDNIESYIYVNMYKANLYSSLGSGESSNNTLFTEGDNFLGQVRNLTKDSNHDTSQIELNGTVEVIIYGRNGKILNSSEIFSGLNKLKMDKKSLNEVKEVSVNGTFREKEHYRYKTIAVKDKQFPKVAYVTIAVSVNQLDAVSFRYRRIVIFAMVIFWLLSIFASFYLANWSRKPILVNYEKQKTFVEDASHELRTPLTVLQNRLESLFRRPDETIMQNYETIASSLEEVRNMRLLTTNLLNLARRDDRLEPNFEEIEPSFFDTIFENYEMIAQENRKSFYHSNQVTSVIRSDKLLIKQLMTIFFDNAVKYTSDDGSITIVVSTDDKNLKITIADNGFGISQEDKIKIFDRFYRIDKARTRQTGGFGLGLSLAKQIVDSLHGNIIISDNVPKGTIFEIRL